MQKTFLYIALSIIATVFVIVSSVILYEKFFINPPEIISPLSTKKVVDKGDKILKLETTLSEIKYKDKTEILTIVTEIDDYINSQKYNKEKNSVVLSKPLCDFIEEKPKRVKKVFTDNIPRLAIIMDDIGNARQVRELENIPYAITPSIFPATKRHKHTPEFAKKFNCYMVHMPMEAFNFSHPEENTLEVSDTLESLEEKIATMYQDFPNAIAINNHTGSKFTSDAKAMDRLFCVLDKYNINFIDSKTAPHSRGIETGKLHNRVVLERNIFLDNEPDVVYILNQLKKAVRYAKRHGTAIAICHPRPETFKAFKEAAYLLKEVKLVYIDELL